MKKIYNAIAYANKFVSVKFIRFCCVGILNTGIDFSIYLVLTRATGFFSHHYVYANCISFAVAVTNSFFLNRKWTFENKEAGIKKQYATFIFISLIGLCINSAILFSLTDFAKYPDLISKAIAVSIVLFWNYTMNKRVTFKA